MRVRSLCAAVVSAALATAALSACGSSGPASSDDLAAHTVTGIGTFVGFWVSPDKTETLQIHRDGTGRDATGCATFAGGRHPAHIDFADAHPGTTSGTVTATVVVVAYTTGVGDAQPGEHWTFVKMRRAQYGDALQIHNSKDPSVTSVILYRALAASSKSTC